MGDLSFLKDNQPANGNYARLLAPRGRWQYCPAEKRGVGEDGWDWELNRPDTPARLGEDPQILAKQKGKTAKTRRRRATGSRSY